MSITEKLTVTLSSIEKKLDSKTVKDYEKSLRKFESLVKTGIIKKRGNTTHSKVELTSYNIRFNN